MARASGLNSFATPHVTFWWESFATADMPFGLEIFVRPAMILDMRSFKTLSGTPIGGGGTAGRAATPKLIRAPSPHGI